MFARAVKEHLRVPYPNCRQALGIAGIRLRSLSRFGRAPRTPARAAQAPRRAMRLRSPRPVSGDAGFAVSVAH